MKPIKASHVITLLLWLLIAFEIGWWNGFHRAMKHMQPEVDEIRQQIGETETRLAHTSEVQAEILSVCK